MSEVQPTDRLTRVTEPLERICKAFAVMGGLVLCSIAVMTVISTLSRKFFIGAISGDFEMVEVGCAVAISLFLPYCQLKNGNVIVDFFTLKTPQHTKRWMDALGCLLLTLVAMLMTWRLSAGGISLFQSNDQTMVLQIGTWWPFLVIVPCMFLLSVVGVLTTIKAIMQSDIAPPQISPQENQK